MIHYEEMNIWRFGDEYPTRIPMAFLLGALHHHQDRVVHDDGFHPEKSVRIREALDSGIDPLSFDPVRVYYYHCEGVMCIFEGFHRIRVFEERGIPQINANFGVYFSLQPPKKYPPLVESAIKRSKAVIQI